MECNINERIKCMLTYTLAARTNNSHLQHPGKAILVAHPLLRRSTDLTNAVRLTFLCTGSSALILLLKGVLTISETETVEKSRFCQQRGLRVALYHDLHTNGTSNINDSIPTHPNTFTKQSMHKSPHCRIPICLKV